VVDLLAEQELLFVVEHGRDGSTRPTRGQGQGRRPQGRRVAVARRAAR
jgi:hypothetical protein